MLDTCNACYFTYLTYFCCCCLLQDLLECTWRVTFWRQQKVGALSSTKLLQFVCLVILFFCVWVLVDESSSDPFARPSVMWFWKMCLMMAVLTLRIFRLSAYHIFLFRLHLVCRCSCFVLYTWIYMQMQFSGSCMLSSEVWSCHITKTNTCIGESSPDVGLQMQQASLWPCGCGRVNSITVSIARVFAGDVELVSFWTETWRAKSQSSFVYPAGYGCGPCWSGCVSRKACPRAFFQCYFGRCWHPCCGD